VISYNRKALENLGGKLEDYVGKSVGVLFPKREAEVFLERIEKAVSCEHPHEYEDFFVFSSGSKWLTSTFTRIMNSNGELAGVQVASVDITERKMAEEALMESEAILKAAFENSQAGIAIADVPDGRLRYVNKAGLRIINISEEESAKNTDIRNYVDSLRILHMDGTPFRKEEIPLARAVFRGEAVSEEFVIRRDDGEDRYVFANAVPIKDSNGNVKAGMVLLLDITEKRQAENRIRKQNELFTSLLKTLPVGVFMVDGEGGGPLVANDMAKALLGRGIMHEANEDTLAEVYRAFKGDTKKRYPSNEMPIVLGMKGIDSHIDDMVVERPDGSRVLLEVFGTSVKDENNRPWASLVTFINITERKKTENELLFLSYHDQLTGFYNRRYFEDRLRNLDKEANLPLSIIICDINGLKLVNDSFGHDFGDRLIKRAAETIREACRADDIVSRIGGDEFAVILPNTDVEILLSIVNKIKSLAQKQKVENIDLSLSCGYDTKKSAKQSIGEVMANAENHMYRHKLYEHSSMRSKTIDIIMKTLFEKSTRESQHSNRVSTLCKAIAKKMDFDKDDVNKIGIAGLVHDIGKIGIDEKTLNKPGRLDADEREQINRHPEIGWRILSSVNEFSDLAQCILAHHERWDGNGYPNGLRGEQIPLEARIISIADSYDAMTSQRSYKAGRTQEEAVKELMRCAGTQFDPKIVEVFVNQVLIGNLQE